MDKGVLCDCCGEEMTLLRVENDYVDKNGIKSDIEYYVCSNCGSECLWKFCDTACMKSFWDNVNKQFFKVFYAYEYFHEEEVLGNER